MRTARHFGFASRPSTARVDRSIADQIERLATTGLPFFGWVARRVRSEERNAQIALAAAIRANNVPVREALLFRPEKPVDPNKQFVEAGGWQGRKYNTAAFVATEGRVDPSHLMRMIDAGLVWRDATRPPGGDSEYGSLRSIDGEGLSTSAERHGNLAVAAMLKRYGHARLDVDPRAEPLADPQSVGDCTR